MLQATPGSQMATAITLPNWHHKSLLEGSIYAYSRPEEPRPKPPDGNCIDCLHHKLEPYARGAGSRASDAPSRRACTERLSLDRPTAVTGTVGLTSGTGGHVSPYHRDCRDREHRQ